MRKIRLLISAHIGHPRGGISFQYETILNSSLKEKVDLYFVDTSTGNLLFSQRGRWKLRNIVNATQNINRFMMVFLKVKPDLVHVATVQGASFIKNSFFILFSKALNTKVVIHPHCSISRLFPKRSKIMQDIVKYIFSRSDGVVVISKEWLKLAEYLPDLPICYIPNAIDINPYIEIVKPKLMSSSGPVNILYLGHIGQEKGSHDLIEASKMMKYKSHAQFRVNMYGEDLGDGEIELIRSEIIKNNLLEEILIFPPEYGVGKYELFRNADIYVLPSHHEGMPISIIEAMAAALPVVATDVGGIPDLIIDEVTGLLTEPGNPSRLADGLLRLVMDSELRIKMGLAGRQRVIDNFSIENQIDKLVIFYSQIIEAK